MIESSASELIKKVTVGADRFHRLSFRQEDWALYKLLQKRLDAATAAGLTVTEDEAAATLVPAALLAGVSGMEVPGERLWSEDPLSLRLQWRAVVGAVESLEAKLAAAGLL